MNNIDRCFYCTSTFDPESSLPLYVLDTTFLPSSITSSSSNTNIDSQPKLQNFIDKIINKLPDENHALIIFTNGFYQSNLTNNNNNNNTNSNGNSNSNSNNANTNTNNNDNSNTLESIDQSTSNFKIPLNIIKLLKLIPPEFKKYLTKIYIVHSTWILKSVVDIFTKFYSFNSNSNPIIINCENLTSLSKYIDLTKIPISLHTYMIDKIQYKNNKIILNRHFAPLYSRPLTIYSLHNSNPINSSLPLNQFQRIFNNLIAYLSNKDLDVQLSNNDWITIIKCSTLSNETKISIDILSDCLKRDQLIILSDYSFLEHYMIIIKFILKLSNSKYPLIPLEILIDYKIDFNNLNQVNNFLNKILTYRHPLIDFKDSTTIKFQSIQNFNNNNNNNDNNNINSTSTDINNTIDSYDNAYILIKIFKLFKYLLNKLQRETEILEPNAKNLKKSKERQSLRLILAFTKILYTDNNEDSLISNDEDDIGFDNLFKLIRSIMENFDDLTILGTNYSIDDFNNHINFDDFLAFENFKNKQLGVQDVIESTIVHNHNSTKNSNNIQTSPVKPKKQLDLSSPIPLPPMPRKNPLLYIDSENKNKNTDNNNNNSKDNNNNTNNNNNKSSKSVYSNSENFDSSSNSINSSITASAADISITITESEVDILAKSIESLGIEEKEHSQPGQEGAEEETEGILKEETNMFKTPQRQTSSCNVIFSDNEPINDLVSDLLTPTKPNNLENGRLSKTIINKSSTNSLLQNIMPIKNNNLRKYTEKDLAVQQRVEQEKQAALIKEQHAKEVELGVRRGERKVSRLARLYEEKFMN